MKNLRFFLVLVIVSCLLRPALMVSNRLPGSAIKTSRRAAPSIPFSSARFSSRMPRGVFTGCTTGPVPCVQSASSVNVGIGDTHDVVLPGAQTAGNFNFVTFLTCIEGGCAADPTTTTCAVTDTNGNSYTLLYNIPFNGDFLLCGFYAENIAGGSNTVHFAAGSGISGVHYYVGGEVAEFSGVQTSSSLDQKGNGWASGSPGTTALTASTTSPTTHGNDLVIAGGYSRFTTRTPGSPYAFVDSTSSTVNTEFTTVSMTGTQTATMTGAIATSYVLIIGAFKCATDCSGGGGGLTPAQKARGFSNLLPF